MPQSKPFRSGKEPPALGRDSLPEISLGNLDDSAHNFDDNPMLSSLRDLIAAGDLLLDPMLAAISDAALQMTGASGAALAMWREGAMVCRARSGSTAPVLGARLSTDTGISGECLRTGKIQHCLDTENDPLVDVEVCRTLGLRSIAVFPIRGWRAINGILEVFATRPSAFTEGHLALLQQLALLAERARASQPYGASPTALQPPDVNATPAPQSSGILPASDRVGDVALAVMGARSRPFILGAIGLAVLSLTALVIWLGWRGSDETDSKTRPKMPTSAATTVNAATPLSPETDPVWKANPGGESVLLSVGKDSTGNPVRLASKVEGRSGKKTPVRSWSDQPFLLSDVAPDGVTPDGGSSSPTASPKDSNSGLPPAVEPPSISVGSTNQSTLNGVLSAKASLPGLSAPVSLGVSGGQLMHHVPPVYPTQARMLRLEGTVVLDAVIMEDGSVHDVKVVTGQATLAQSAVEAVKHWQYKPYVLDGKPVKNEIRINVDFKMPIGGR